MREVVHETTNRIEAELLTQGLLAEGIDAWLDGVSNAALLGASEIIFPLKISVPAEQVDRAREVMQALREPFEPLPEEPDEPERGPSDRRRVWVAAGCAFVVPGGCHFYVGRRITGAVLLASWTAALFALIRIDAHAPMAAASLPLIAFADLLGGLHALRAERRGQVVSTTGQLLRGVLYLTLIAAVAWLPQGWTQHRQAKVESAAGELQLQCTRQTVIVSYRGSAAQRLVLREPELRIDEWNGLRSTRAAPESMTLNGRSQVELSLPPGSQATLRLSQVDSDRCGQRLTSCSLHLGLSVEIDEERVSGTADCPWPESESDRRDGWIALFDRR